jgi:hypothetical protein
MTPKDGEDPLKKGTIAVLTLIFVALYVAGIIGVWRGDSAANSKAITLLQPIVYVIIGYYFGRMPAEKTEKALKEQADKKDQEAGAAKAEAARSSTKLRATKSVLEKAVGQTDAAPPTGFAQTLSTTRASNEDALKITIAQALNVIDS